MILPPSVIASLLVFSSACKNLKRKTSIFTADLHVAIFMIKPKQDVSFGCTWSSVELVDKEFVVASKSHNLCPAITRHLSVKNDISLKLGVWTKMANFPEKKQY